MRIRIAVSACAPTAHWLLVKPTAWMCVQMLATVVRADQRYVQLVYDSSHIIGTIFNHMLATCLPSMELTQHIDRSKPKSQLGSLKLIQLLVVSRGWLLQWCLHMESVRKHVVLDNMRR